MKNYKRSDLACEATEDLKNIDGVEHEMLSHGDFSVEIFKIKTDEAARRLERKKGTYVTFSSKEIWKLDGDELSSLAELVGKELRLMLLSLVPSDARADGLSVMLVGLGNAMITADAIGPRTLDRIEVTRHIKKLDPSLFNMLSSCEISAIAPGVFGKTGIESAEIVKATCLNVCPHALIVIDALAAGSVERLARTVQISDAGINPGSGIGNLRFGLSRETLDIPVIAIGVPTVVDTSAVVFDTLCRAGLSESIPDELIQHLDSTESFYVTPKESDMMTEKISIMLADSISRALVIN